MSVNTRASAAASGINRSADGRLPAVTALIIVQLITAALLAWQGGTLLWIGMALAVATLALGYPALRAGGGSADRQLLEALRTAAEEEGDLSIQLPETGAGRERETAAAFNRFMERLRSALEDLRRHSIKVTLTSAHSRKSAEEAQRDAGQQEEYSELIYNASDETARAIEELSSRTNAVAETNSRNLEAAQASVRDLARAAEQIGEVSHSMRDFHGTVQQLETTSENIQAILGTVQGFAAQTNMLALNAAIEAARAGEQGRGFAVVADEVRNLAVKVRGSADEIGELLETMTDVVSRTTSGAEQMIDKSEHARETVDQASSQFHRMVNDFETTHADLLQVSSATEELSVTNRDIHARSGEIRDIGTRIKQDMERSNEQTAELLEFTDEALQKLCQFRIGRGQLEQVLETAERRRDVIQAEIEKLVDQGVDMFDRNHVPIPNTDPQKHDVSWARPFQQACQHLIDEWAAAEDGALYCLPLDNKGYVAIHRSELSHPPSGDREVDLARSRHMRFFQSREIPHMGRFRLQSYLRDTGEVMFNLSVPIEVKGRYWGGLFMGLPAATLGIE